MKRIDSPPCYPNRSSTKWKTLNRSLTKCHRNLNTNSLTRNCRQHKMCRRHKCKTPERLNQNVCEENWEQNIPPKLNIFADNLFYHQKIAKITFCRFFWLFCFRSSERENINNGCFRFFFVVREVCIAGKCEYNEYNAIPLTFFFEGT